MVICLSFLNVWIMRHCRNLEDCRSVSHCVQVGFELVQNFKVSSGVSQPGRRAIPEAIQELPIDCDAKRQNHS
jgi:hypothetical protein